ncbi:hypothetical protein Tco_1028512 [Tanacetum coccineum]|uniref:Uncharacterized protein n=1 Tax=Tanacetum coccineum TaxID=301880 RepID=A0ABQ5CHY3_9ASTR
MNPSAAEQIALNNALVTPESLLSRILDHCWSSKNIHALVLEYSYQDLPKLPDQPFDIPPSTDEEIVSFIYEIGYT